MRKKWDLPKGCVIALAILAVLAVLFYFVAGEQLQVRFDATDAVSPSASVGEILPGTTLSQQFSSPGGRLTGFSVLVGTFARQNRGTMYFSVSQQQPGQEPVLIETFAADLEQMQDNSWCQIWLSDPVEDALEKQFTLTIWSEGCQTGQAATVYFGNSIATGRFEIGSEGWEPLQQNGVLLDGTLCLQVYGETDLWFGQYYWAFALGAELLAGLYCLRLCRLQAKGKSCFGLRFIHAVTHYRFLIQQLVSRDFKTKYKRSVLGIVWSFLNPLLTMTVQYVVFSTIFKSDVPNFPVYLLTGIVLFNFFNEACSMGITSILGNASLITKVYVPKYIYPVTRVLSSGINMLFSLVPLFLVMLATQTKITPALLLFPFTLVCLLCFCTGLVLILSAAMVFFRDTQFLWNVLSMIWMYATPIFYPESIIPARFLTIYKMNPLYHFIRFARMVIMDGVSPEPKAYLICFVFALGSLLIGGLIFRKVQDKFVLYL